MNETKEPIITNEVLEEAKEFGKELQQENKEILDIMQSTLYKTLYQVLKRVTIKMEITNIDNISRPITPGAKTEAKKEDSNEEWIVQDLNGVMILKELDNSYLVLKEGYSTVVAYSHLTSRDNIKVGKITDLNDLIKADRKWILKAKKSGKPNLEWQEFESNN